MSKLFDLFGFSGMLSLAFWVLCWACLIMAFRTAKVRYCLLALAAVVVGQIFAGVNSTKISAYRTAPSEEAQEEVAASMLPSQARLQSEHLFIEESVEDVASMQRAQKQPDEGLAAYRAAGTQAREQGDQPSEWVQTVEEEETAFTRYLPSVDVLLANRWDSLNLGVGKFSFWAAFLSIILLYIWNFNRLRMQSVPLPLAGSLMDLIRKPKTFARLPEASTEQDLSAYLDFLIQRGETFLCFGSPAVGDSYARWQFGPIQIDRLPVKQLPLPSSREDKEFLFDALWFNRLAVCVAVAPDAHDLLDFFTGILRGRIRLHASARRCVVVILPAEASQWPGMDEFFKWAPAANFRIVFYGKSITALPANRQLHEILFTPLLSPLLREKCAVLQKRISPWAQPLCAACSNLWRKLFTGLAVLGEKLGLPPPRRPR